MQNTGCPPTTSKVKLRSESVNFSDVPGQSQLFLQYQADATSLKKYYPSAVQSHVDLSGRVAEVIDSYSVDRQKLCEVLSDQNRRFGSAEKTFRHIELLRKENTVAILTGQQTGLFTGPLYTIYKALSAIKMAECLRDRGVDTVPIFWAATEDHDFDEIAAAFVLGASGKEIEFRIPASDEFAGQPVGAITISKEAAVAFRASLDELPETEFTGEVRSRILETWSEGRTIGEAFCSHLQQLFADQGLIVVDPLDQRLKKLSRPVYQEAVNRVDEIVPALLSRSKELVDDGFHAQVLITEDYFPLFFHDDDGVRRSVRRNDDRFHVSGTKVEFSKDDLSRIATEEPNRFSPGVMLRPVVQDYLFPTLCYFGGGAEIAYFAQNSEVYRLLKRPVTPILHRQSFTLIESKHARTLAKYDLKFTDLFAMLDKLLPKIIEEFVNPGGAERFDESEADINGALDSLDQELVRVDPTLAANLATRRKKVLYHIAALRKKFHRVQLERDEIVNRQLRSLFAALLPDGHLQERKLDVASFEVLMGPHLIASLYDSIDLDERGHRLLYL